MDVSRYNKDMFAAARLVSCPLPPATGASSAKMFSLQQESMEAPESYPTDFPATVEQEPSKVPVIHAYLLLIEDRKTNTCHPSYNTIATETGLSKNTALKSISILLEAGLITVEPSSYFDRRGMKWKGNNLYTILPIHSAVDTFHRRQLQQLEINVAKSRLAAQSAV